MRSFSPSLRTATLTAFLIAIPLTGAYAASHNRGVLDPTTPSDLTGQRVEALIEQAQGVRQGIVDARQANSITPAVAEHLEMRTNQISRTAEKIAASDHGRIPAAQYHDLLRHLDNVDQRLRVDTGNDFLMGGGSDSGSYPNG
jgi:hypothetical protein